MTWRRVGARAPRACAAAAMFGLSGAELAAAEQDAARALAAADRHLEAAERQLRAPRAAPPLAPGGACCAQRGARREAGNARLRRRWR